MAGQAAATGDMLDEPDETYFTLASMPRRLSRTFPFVYTYAANWTVKDAFREFVQNTRDAMIEAGFDPQKNTVTSTEKTEGDKIEMLDVFHSKGKCHGYIQFHGTHEEGRVIEITNRDGRLKLADSDLSRSARKQTNPSIAGHHGGGMKIAILIIMRRKNSHLVTILASNSEFAFSWRQESGNLGLTCTKMDAAAREKVMQRSKKDFNAGLIPFVKDPGKDVQILIGVEGRRKDKFR